MSDLVEKLRNGYPCLEGGSDHTCRVRNAASGCLCATAADRIAKLEAALRAIKRGTVWNADIEAFISAVLEDRT